MKLRDFRGLSIIFLFIASGAVAQTRTVSFLPPVEVVVSGVAGIGTLGDICSECIAVADFNNDGIPDIAWVYLEQVPYFGVALGNGDGTFQPVANPFPSQPSGGLLILTADFNGDGKPDLLYHLLSGHPAIALGNGDGTFQSQIPVNGCTSFATIADVNRDGKADLICGTSILLSNGDGTFGMGTTVDPNLMDTVLLTADFNHDGKPDLLLQRLYGHLAVALGNGDGTFAADLPVSTVLTDPITGDFNGDGHLDLVGTCTNAGLICVLTGAGDGTFGTAILTMGSFPSGSFTAAADFNGDGKADLLSGNALLLANGDGTFQTPVFFGPVLQPCGPVCSYATVAGVVADFNGDGLPDIAAASVIVFAPYPSRTNSSVIAVLLNDSPGDGFLTAGVSSATMTWPVGQGSIVSAFGVNLAPSTAAASNTGALPTTLGGIRVHVRDRLVGDTLAPLLYVSPTQINYVISSADVYPWVGIERVGTPYVPKGIAVPVTPVAPGIYSVGANLAAASALTVAPDGTETFVPVTSCSGSSCASAPIDLSGLPVYLSLYGTGFAQASAEQSTCTVAGQTLPATYAGPQLQIAGLDQVNMLLPKSLTGAGPTSVTCQMQSFAGVGGIGNAVSLTIR